MPNAGGRGTAASRQQLLRGERLGVHMAIITGALFDFLGYATAQPGTVSLGAGHPVDGLADALRDWAIDRQLDLSHADVAGWRKLLGRVDLFDASAQRPGLQTRDMLNSARSGQT